MPYSAKQRKAIAAKMSREGKSRQQISAFFKAHGPVKTTTKRPKPKSRTKAQMVTRG